MCSFFADGRKVFREGANLHSATQDMWLVSCGIHLSGMRRGQVHRERGLRGTRRVMRFTKPNQSCTQLHLHVHVHVHIRVHVHARMYVRTYALLFNNPSGGMAKAGAGTLPHRLCS